MRKLMWLVIILLSTSFLVLVCYLAIAQLYSTTTFSDGSTSSVANFNGKGTDASISINLPKNATITYATMNLTGSTAAASGFIIQYEKTLPLGLPPWSTYLKMNNTHFFISDSYSITPPASDKTIVYNLQGENVENISGIGSDISTLLSPNSNTIWKTRSYSLTIHEVQRVRGSESPASFNIPDTVTLRDGFFNGTHFFILDSYGTDRMRIYNISGVNTQNISYQYENVDICNFGTNCDKSHFYTSSDATIAQVLLNGSSITSTDSTSYNLDVIGFALNSSHMFILNSTSVNSNQSAIIFFTYSSSINLPENVTVHVNGSVFFNNSGTFNTTNATIDFVAYLQSALSTCTANAAGNCSIPINISSDSAGVVTVYELNINYSFNHNPTLYTNLVFANHSRNHGFNVTVVFNDLDNSSDINYTSLYNSSGACAFVSNTTNNNYYTAKYNCTGTALTAVNIQINATDSYGQGINSSLLSNKFPNNLPTMTITELNQTSGVTTGNDLNCSAVGIADTDTVDTPVYHYDWYKDAVSQGIDDVRLAQSNLSAGEDWYCAAWVTDSYQNSSKYTSSTVTIDSSESSPVIVITNATTTTTRILSNTTPTNNNSWINLSVEFTDANDDKWTAYFCTVPTWADCYTNTSNSILCRSETNLTGKLLSCAYSVSGVSVTGLQTYYAFVLDNTSKQSTLKSSNYQVNHPPTVPVLQNPANAQVYTVSWAIINYSSTDLDSDSINYSIYNSTDNSLFTLSYFNTSWYNWTSINDGTYYIKSSAMDKYSYSSVNSSSTYFSIDTTAPTVNRVSVSSSSVYTTDTVTLIANVTDSVSGVSSTSCKFEMYKSDLSPDTFNLTSNTLSGNEISKSQLVTSYDTGTLFWQKTYCTDAAGNLRTNITNINITISEYTAPVLPGGGGTAPPAEPPDIQAAVQESLMQAAICGNSNCQSGENPINCPADCPLNVEELFCWIGETEGCAAWVFNVMIYIIIGSVLFVAYRQQVGYRPSKKRQRW